MQAARAAKLAQDGPEYNTGSNTPIATSTPNGKHEDSEPTADAEGPENKKSVQVVMLTFVFFMM